MVSARSVRNVLTMTVAFGLLVGAVWLVAGSQARAASSTPVVYVATGENFPDALGGGPVAAMAKGPILLVRQNSIPGETAAELTRLAPDKIVILGGTAAVSVAVETALAGFAPTVERIAGSNRYDTAAKLSAATYPVSFDADTLDGKDSTFYTTILAGAACEFGTCTDSIAFAITSVTQVTVNAPVAGVLDIDYTWAGSISPAVGDLVQTWATVDTATACGGWFFAPLESAPGTYSAIEPDGGTEIVNTAGTTVVAVGAGNHTINVCTIATDALNTDQAGLSVAWSAEGSGLSLTAAAVADIDHLKAIMGEDVPNISG